MNQIHFEVFARRPRDTGFTLEFAGEDRAVALETAEDLLASGRAATVKVTKEILDLDTREFQSVVILTKGETAHKQAIVAVEDLGPLCVTPQDLYTAHARDRIGELLEGWFGRYRVTPFELLHRPDLIERLDASGTDLRHAIQKVAVPEAHARGLTTHEVLRHFTELTQRAMDRVLTDAKKGRLPDLQRESFDLMCRRYADDPERGYLLGCAVAAKLAGAQRWSDKVSCILDLADQAPRFGPGHAAAFAVLEEPLGEILGSRVGLSDLLGPELDLGGSLAALARLAAAESVEPLIQVDAAMKRLMPELNGAAARLAPWFSGQQFEGVRAAIGRRVLSELTGPRRLRPNDPAGEIEILRSLAMALTASAGRLMPLEDVRAAFVERSKSLVSSDFVQIFLEEPRPAIQEARDLVRLLENVTGGVNKRQAARWVSAIISGLRFENELRAGSESPAARLASLADLQRLVARVASDNDVKAIHVRLGEVGGMIETDSKLTASLAKASAPLAQRLAVLLKLASGEGAPTGPAADRAKAQVLKLLRTQEAAETLSASEDLQGQVRALMQPNQAAA
jgi:hypothetical protein